MIFKENLRLMCNVSFITQCQKSRKGFRRNLKTAFYLHWKHQKKTNWPLRKIEIKKNCFHIQEETSGKCRIVPKTIGVPVIFNI